MPIQKQNLNINFGQGMDTKTDPYQLTFGKFDYLKNSVFTTTNRITKRDGFAPLTSLPDKSSTFSTTYNGNLTAIGDKFYAYNRGNDQWSYRGNFHPASLSTIPIVRNSLNQTQVDSVVAPNGLVCTVYTENAVSQTNYYYAVNDQITGQNIVRLFIIPTPSESPRVFLLGNYFIILYSATANLNYIAVPIYNPEVALPTVTLVTNYGIGSTQLAFDGVVWNNTLYVGYNGSDGGGAIRATALNSFLVRQTANTGVVVASAKRADILTVAADETSGEVWFYFYTATGTDSFVLAIDGSFNISLAATQVTTSDTILNIAIAAIDRNATIFYEVANNYSFDSTIPSHFTLKNTIEIGGTVGTATRLERSVGLASKAFIVEEKIYVLVTYSSPYQPTYFLVDAFSNIVAKIAYENGQGYLTLGLPGVSVYGTKASIPYLLKDLIQAVNKNTNVPAGSQVNGIYSQLGINLATIDLSTSDIGSAEIGANLHLTGGFLWSYDGSIAAENNFFLYPDLTLNADGTYHGLTTSVSGGNLSSQKYFYQVTYEWTDNQGNAYRSAPSIPVSITASGPVASNTLIVPTLRLTYKSDVKIVIYRWSVAQQAYYQVTSITSPTLNSVTTDTVTFVDTLSDAEILGNNLLYTSGGVVENVGPPAFKAITLFNTRLVGIVAEDPNTLWYSKQVISNTPVEMSDLFTLYTPPTTGSQASTGDNACLFPMDDKLIIFKRNAGLYYLTGIGPDNTGANNDFSNAVFINSTIGCGNQASIVLIPQGLMFQDGTGKGIWLLGRDLSTVYIGAGVEKYNDINITSAFAIPGTNEVRFTLETGTVLVYDYYQQQWDVFESLSALSSCLYEGMHTFIDNDGRVFQQTPNTYLDGTTPVTIAFRTGWLNLASLQGFQRAYEFYLLGTYKSPHKLIVSIGYDYNPSPSQVVIINPINYSAPWGSDPFWGSSSPWGGSFDVEQWRIFLTQQQCQAFQITVEEVFDKSFGAPAGAGLSLSGINLVVGLKKGYPRLSAEVQAS